MVATVLYKQTYYSKSYWYSTHARSVHKVSYDYHPLFYAH